PMRPRGPWVGPLGARSAQPGDRLVLQVARQALGAELAAEAAGLVAAEWRARLDHVAVDAVGAGPHLPGHLHAALGVGRPDRPGQAVLAVVGDPHRVRLVLVRNDGQDRAEDLLAGDAHVVGDAGEDRRRHVPAAVARPLQPADDDL